MPKTKLEVYVDVLKILAQKDSQNANSIAVALNVGVVELKMCLSFLLKQGLVDKQKVGFHGLDFLITPMGIRVLRHFNELKQRLPSIEEIRVS
jgi:predicted transcriptional regulator